MYNVATDICRVVNDCVCDISYVVAYNSCMSSITQLLAFSSLLSVAYVHSCRQLLYFGYKLV